MLQSPRPTLVKCVTFSSRAADNSDAAKFRSTFPSRPPSKTWLKLQYFRQAGDGCLLQLSEPHGIMGNLIKPAMQTTKKWPPVKCKFIFLSVQNNSIFFFKKEVQISKTWVDKDNLLFDLFSQFLFITAHNAAKVSVYLLGF